MKIFYFVALLVLSFSASAVVQTGQYSVCASDPSPVQYCAMFRGSSLGCGLSKTAACGAAAPAVGITTGVAANEAVAADMYCYDSAHIGDAGYAYTNFPLSQNGGGCPAGTTAVGTRCIVTAFSALPTDKQRAIIVIPTRDTQAAADAACLNGIAAAQAGKTLDQIAAAAFGTSNPCQTGQSYISSTAADGTISYKCINSNGTTASSSGVPASQCPAGQNYIAAVDAAGITRSQCWGKDQNGNLVLMSQDGVLTPAGQAAAAAGGGGAGQGSASSTSSTSSTPPAPTMPDFVAASGIFYTKGAITGGKSLTDVLTNFKTQISTTPIIDAAIKFFSFSGLNGASCPVSSFSFTLFEHSYSFTLDLFCTPLMDTFLTVCAVLFMISAAYYSFRIAFM